MNEIVNKFLLTGNKFMPKMHLRQPGFSYNACGPFTKNSERIQKFKGTGNSRYIYQNEINKVFFQLGIAYGDFKDLSRKKICLEKQNMMDINVDLLQWFINFMIKKTFGANTSAMRVNKFEGDAVQSEIMSSQELAEELHKPIIRKFEK